MQRSRQLIFFVILSLKRKRDVSATFGRHLRESFNLNKQPDDENMKISKHKIVTINPKKFWIHKPISKQLDKNEMKQKVSLETLQYLENMYEEHKKKHEFCIKSLHFFTSTKGVLSLLQYNHLYKTTETVAQAASNMFESKLNFREINFSSCMMKNTNIRIIARNLNTKVLLTNFKSSRQ